MHEMIRSLKEIERRAKDQDWGQDNIWKRVEKKKLATKTKGNSSVK